MKRLLMVVLAFFALQISAQDKKDLAKKFKQNKTEHLKKMNPEQLARLQAKKMTLTLDLTDKQQQKVEVLLAKNAASRKAKRKKRMALKLLNQAPSQEEKFKMQNERLDQRIATKRELKKILTPEQYTAYNKKTLRKMNTGKRNTMKRKRNKN